MKVIKPFDPETGEELTESSPIEQLSKARAFFVVEASKFSDISDLLRDWLKPHYTEAIESGETKFLDFWQIRWGSRRFSKTLFAEKAPANLKAEYDALQERVKEIEEEYKEVGEPTITLPRF